MDNIWIKNYVEKYLIAQQCHIIEKNKEKIEAKLSIDADKDLMNRSFYWTFVERTNAEPETLTVRWFFNTEKQEEKGENIYFGSNRLQQIFNSIQKRGNFIRLYEQTNINKNTSYALTPWFNINYKISMLSDRKKDIIISLGINLYDGQIIDKFYEKLNNILLTPQIPNHAYTLPANIRIKEAELQFEQWILRLISKEDLSWVDEAFNQLIEEIKQVEYYYSKNNQDQGREKEENENEKRKKIEELKWQYSPRIEANIINLGIFYLK